MKTYLHLPENSFKKIQKFWSVLGVCTCLGLFSCGIESILDPTNRVNGVIVDEYTKLPLDSVLVQLHEDREGPFMGSEVIREATTDKTGRYDFSFEWVEGPYKLTISRPRYGYFSLLKGLGPLPDRYINFKSLEGNPVKKHEEINFAMEAYGSLTLKIKNANPNDILVLQISKLRKDLPQIPVATLTGPQDQTFDYTQVAANQYIRFLYTVNKGGVTQAYKDSVFIKPFQKNTFTLNY